MRSGMLFPLLALTGCAAAKAGLQIVAAEGRLSRAEAQGADEKSVYEYTLAARYLEKAREEAADAEYRIADALARASAEWSDKSVITLQRQRTVEIELVPVDAAPTQPDQPADPIPTPDDGIDDFDTPADEDTIEVDGPR